MSTSWAEYMRKYRRTHPDYMERGRQQSKRWNAEHKEWAKESHKQWRDEKKADKEPSA